jgi:hypothetical protein
MATGEGHLLRSDKTEVIEVGDVIREQSREVIVHQSLGRDTHAGRQREPEAGEPLIQLVSGCPNIDEGNCLLCKGQVIQVEHPWSIRVLGGTWAETRMQKRLTNNITAMIGKGVGRDVGGNNHPGENWLLLLSCSGVDHGGRDKSAITA